MLSYNTLRLNKYFFYALIVCVISSCKSNYALLTIENVQHASKELPQDIQSVTLMNRSMNKQFQNYREDSLQMYFYRKGFQLSTIVLDSTAADTTLKALASLMFESGRYDVVIPVNRNINRNLPYDALPDQLSQSQVRNICSNFKTDALMVMERFSTKTMADISEEKYFEPGQGYVKSYNATLDLNYNAYFRVYRPEGEPIVQEVALTDTIYWESSDITLERLFNKLPTVKQALINAGIKVALDLDSKLSPTWIQEKRGYYIIKPQGDAGQKYMKDNDLDNAGKYWEEMAQSANRKTRSMAEYNLALLSELNGDIDKAIKYSIKSYYSFYRHQTENYIKKLEARKKDLQKKE